MTPIGTSRLYRPDPSTIGLSEQWGLAAVTATATAGSLVISVHGELDASNATRLADYVERHVAVSETLVVDTTACDFFGAPALAALHRVDRCCRASGVRWRLVVGPALRRVMRACGTDDLPQAESVASALQQLASASS